MYQVLKRDGAVVDFNISKIATAITKAFKASDTQYNEDVIDFIALKVTANFSRKIKDGKIAKFGTVEEVMTKENLAEIYQVDFEILTVAGKPLSIYY